MTVDLRDDTLITQLRPPADVLTGHDMNGAWATRHSFARTMLRRAHDHRWTVSKDRAELDVDGRGTVVYSVHAEGRTLTFIAFSRTLEEAERTDRVIATSWDVTAALVDRELDADLEADLRRNVPVQEAGRVGPDTLIMTRANRSARFFDYVTECLAVGEQPEPAVIGPSPYLLRSTAFYGNGKFGLKQLADLADDHPLKVPYRSQMLTAWLLRELSMDLVEHLAEARAASEETAAARLNPQWRRYFGLGNATGLGMVPFVVNHPDYLDAWCRLREIPLARALDALYAPWDPDLTRVIDLLIDAQRHFAEKADLQTAPFLPTIAVGEHLRELSESLDQFRASDGEPARVLAQLHEHAARLGTEARGIVASIITELRDDFDQEADQLLTVPTPAPLDTSMTCGDLKRTLSANYRWISDLDFGTPDSTAYYWYTSANSEEPRRAQRSTRPRSAVEHCTDIARRVDALATALDQATDDTTIAEFLLAHPNHRFAVHRVQRTRDLYYGDIRENLLEQAFLPLSVQRFQLATYGMNNFSPQSTDWLRVTLFSGAPRTDDINNGVGDEDWLFPIAPEEAH